MPRLLCSACVLALLLAAVTAAPVPKERPEDWAYTTTRAGSRWVYDSNGTEAVMEATAVERNDKVCIVTLGTVARGAVRPHGRVCATSDGVFEAPLDGPVPAAPPYYLLKLPHRAGDVWPVKNAAGRTGKATAKGEEDVDVPAGRFKALRVETRWDGEPAVWSFWYAKGVGVVLTAVDGQTNLSLKSFTPGKD